MNYRQLEAFQATLRLNSVTAAAAALNVSQPSVSRLLRELESSLGVRLFHHQKGKLSPTREAELFYEEVDRSFIGLSDLHKAAVQLNDLSLGRLRIGSMQAMSLDVLPLAIRRLSEDFPASSVSFSVRNSRRICELVATHQLDLGVVSSHQDRSFVKVVSTFKTQFVAVLPEGHRLTEQDIVSWDDLSDEPMISLKQDYLLGITKDKGLKKLLKKRLRFEAEQSFTLCSLVRQQLGIALVDPFTAAHFSTLGLVTKKIEANIPFEFHIIHSEQPEPSKAASFFLSILVPLLEGFCAGKPLDWKGN